MSTALVSSSLPTSLRKDEKATSLLSHFETTGQKSVTVGLVRPIGRPKYVKGKEPFEHPKVEAKTSNLSSETFSGTIIDLSKLTFNPVVSAKEA